MDTNHLTREFAECVVAQSEAIHRGDPHAANRFAKRYVAAFQALRALGDQGREALAGLLADERPDVRVTAAGYLLRYKHDLARAVLEREARGRGAVAFGAAQALQRWREGTWALDPEDPE
jgi:hypothetical protein